MASAPSGTPIRGLPVAYSQLIAALLCGLALRLFFITRFPFYAGDTKFYEDLARNWLDHGVYSLFVDGQLMPVDHRMPGYPAFLAVTELIFGRGRIPVMVAQAAIDLATCVFASAIASRIAPEGKKRAAATIALWLAVLCPFTASYTAAVITETLAALFTTLALLTIVWIVTDPALSASGEGARSLEPHDARMLAGSFALAGLVVGLGTLVRPETPLVLAAAGLVLCVRWRHPAEWPKLALATLWMALGLLATLTPWAARNARTLGRIEFLVPHYAESAGDYMPRGFYAWTRTWMVRYRDAYTVTWALGKKPIPLDAIPDAAFDSLTERERVANLLAAYNRDLKIAPALDRKFQELASERGSSHPARTFAGIPIERAFGIWFSPRVDVLRFSGALWPFAEQHRAKPVEFDVTVFFALLDIAYIGLAAAGGWRYRSNLGCLVLVAYLIIRTALLTQLQTVEPRYVVVCFPVVASLAALAFVKPRP